MWLTAIITCCVLFYLVFQTNWTPLLLASCHGKTEVVEILCQYGANTSATTSDGKTPLDYAREKQHKEVERILQKYTSG